MLGQEPAYPRRPSTTLPKCVLLCCCFVFMSAVVLFNSYTQLQHGFAVRCAPYLSTCSFFNWSFDILRQESFMLEKKYASAQSRILI